MTESKSTSELLECDDEDGAEETARIDFVEGEGKDIAVENEIERNSRERAGALCQRIQSQNEEETTH